MLFLFSVLSDATRLVWFRKIRGAKKEEGYVTCAVLSTQLHGMKGEHQLNLKKLAEALRNCSTLKGESAGC